MPLLNRTSKAVLLLHSSGTRIYALCAFIGNACVLWSGVHFGNPARAIAMLLGMAACVLLWIWGDCGTGIRTDNKPAFAYMQTLGFILSAMAGIMLMLAGLDLTHVSGAALAGADFRPTEIVYGFLITVAFTALAMEESLRSRNARKFAATCLAPCSFGAMLAGVLSRDAYVFASGAVYLLGNSCLWFSTSLQRQKGDPETR